jgi:aspartate carbamoyltransferase catalytic subunit
MAETTKHLLAGAQVTPEIFDRISNTANELKDRERREEARREIYDFYDGDPAILSIFGEASSRTKLSFVRAAMSLGVPIHTESNARISLSLAKNESIPDTARTINALDFSLVIFRSDVEGEVAALSEHSRAPVINAGDGPGEHPTQAILDADTFKEAFGRLDDLTIVYAGDPGYSRTAHSLVDLLNHRRNIKHIFVSTPELAITEEFRQHLRDIGAVFEEATSLDDVVDAADAFMFLRFQEERQKKRCTTPEEEATQVVHIERIRQKYLEAIPISKALLKRIKKVEVRLAHPLPRGPELPEDLEGLPAGLWWNQVKKGWYDRRALEYLVLTNQIVFPQFVKTELVPMMHTI